MTASGRKRWAVVTGSSSGLGKASALALGRAGWNVVLHYRQSGGAAEAVAEEIRAWGPSTLILQADFEDPAAGPQLARRAWQQTGGIDAWVHFAGVDLLTSPEAKAPFEHKLELACRIDLISTILTCREIGSLMGGQGSGTIVTVGWDQAATGMEGDSGQIFAATKGGVMAFSRSLAKSLAPKVRVNCISPGWIKTAWGEQAASRWHERAQRETPLQRWGLPEDVAGTVVFLLSEQAGFLTGQTIHVNGGAVTS